MNLLQTIFRRLEVRADLTREEKATVKFIGPLVIRADELCCGAFFRRTDARTAMAAGIVERTDAALCIAHDHDGIGANLHCHVGAGLRQFAIMADK
ncbi:hypothetical protein FQZ97_1160950 [compost metagenome]